MILISVISSKGRQVLSGHPRWQRGMTESCVLGRAQRAVYLLGRHDQRSQIVKMGYALDSENRLRIFGVNLDMRSAVDKVFRNGALLQNFSNSKGPRLSNTSLAKAHPIKLATNDLFSSIWGRSMNPQR